MTIQLNCIVVRALSLKSLLSLDVPIVNYDAMAGCCRIVDYPRADRKLEMRVRIFNFSDYLVGRDVRLNGCVAVGGN